MADRSAGDAWGLQAPRPHQDRPLTAGCILTPPTPPTVLHRHTCSRSLRAAAACLAPPAAWRHPCRCCSGSLRRRLAPTRWVGARGGQACARPARRRLSAGSARAAAAAMYVCHAPPGAPRGPVPLVVRPRGLCFVFPTGAALRFLRDMHAELRLSSRSTANMPHSPSSAVHHSLLLFWRGQARCGPWVHSHCGSLWRSLPALPQLPRLPIMARARMRCLRLLCGRPVLSSH